MPAQKILDDYQIPRACRIVFSVRTPDEHGRAFNVSTYNHFEWDNTKDGEPWSTDPLEGWMLMWDRAFFSRGSAYEMFQTCKAETVMAIINNEDGVAMLRSLKWRVRIEVEDGTNPDEHQA